jgi:hypothetical protein
MLNTETLTRDQLLEKAAQRDADFKCLEFKTARVHDTTKGRVIVVNDDVVAIDNGFKSVAELLGAPTGFLKNTHLDLAQKIVERLTGDVKDKEILLKKDKILAHRTKTGAHVPASEVVEKMLKALPDIEKTIWFDLGKSIDVQILCHGLECKPKVDDIVRGGVRLEYSEFMLRAPEISTFSERLVCLNGMTHRENRVNFKFESASKFLSELSDTVKDCVKYFNSTVEENLKKAASMKAPGDQIIRQAFNRHRIHPRFYDAVLAAHAVENDGTAYGVLQSFTRAANEQTNYLSRSWLQEVGGRELVEVGRAHCPTCYNPLN